MHPARALAGRRQERSGGSGRSGTKKVQVAKYRYELVRFNENGDLFDLNGQELEAFKVGPMRSWLNSCNKEEREARAAREAANLRW